MEPEHTRVDVNVGDLEDFSFILELEAFVCFELCAILFLPDLAACSHLDESLES